MTAAPGSSARCDNANFRLYIGGSSCPSWARAAGGAQSWLVYRLTDSPLLLASRDSSDSAGCSSRAPGWPQRRTGWTGAALLLFTQSSSAVLAGVLGVLTLAGHVERSHVLVVAGLLGVVNAVDIPTPASPSWSEMVGRGDLPNAIALNSVA